MELNDDTIFILGRPCFWCGTIARRLRELGHNIPNHAEEEQAYVINMLLEYYEQYGPGYRSCFKAMLLKPVVVED